MFKMRQDKATNLWSTVHGPAGATLATLRRLQWTGASATQWITDEGVEIDIRTQVGPRSLRKLIDESVVR